MTNKIVLSILVATALAWPRTVNAGACEEGAIDGQESVTRLWEMKLDSDCELIWDLEDEADFMARKKYEGYTRGWSKRVFNKCAKRGVEQMVENYEERCLSYPDQCDGLAEAAAEIIVSEEVCLPEAAVLDEDYLYTTGSHTPDYKRECLEGAELVCPGMIKTTIDNWCPSKDLTQQERNDLNALCRGAILDLIYDF